MWSCDQRYLALLSDFSAGLEQNGGEESDRGSFYLDALFYNGAQSYEGKKPIRFTSMVIKTIPTEHHFLSVNAAVRLIALPTLKVAPSARPNA